jgi:hypothetical protein
MSDEKVIVFLDGPHAGAFLKRYDPDFRDGAGLVEVTEDPSQAQLFPDTVSAWEEWRRPSIVHPVRLTDGKPNRPMSAWTITVLSASTAEDDPLVRTAREG